MFAWSATQDLTVNSEAFDLSPDRPEYCRKPDGTEIDLLRVALLANNKLDLRPYGVSATLSLDGDWIEVRATPDSTVRTYKQNIGYEAVRGERLDVDLAIALYENRPLLRWKETFKHRAARQGLFSIKSDGHLEPLCSGGPTVTVDH